MKAFLLRARYSSNVSSLIGGKLLVSPSFLCSANALCSVRRVQKLEATRFPFADLSTAVALLSAAAKPLQP